MRHSEFIIGTEFMCSGKKYRCTDVGSRTICAISLANDASWHVGPPYAIPELIFDENDFPALDPVT